MALWALADLHLSFGTPNKKMSLFGWHDHENKIKTAWHDLVQPEDLVLIPGDISWAMTLEQAQMDLEWIAALPGSKLMIKGNHDYWWPSISKLRKHLPPSCYALHHDYYLYQEYAICGTRLWDDPSWSPRDAITQQDEAIFQRELIRLETSLKTVPPQITKKIAMLHYPPVDPMMHASATSKLLEQYAVEKVVFGHIHDPLFPKNSFGQARGVEYHLVAADYLEFIPLRIC